MTDVFQHIRKLFPGDGFLPLHEPVFDDSDKALVLDTIDSTFVSSVGKYVDEFEVLLAELAGTKRAVAVVNGTQALYLALKVLDIGPDDLVITQSLTFVATANAIAYTGAKPAFVDVDPDRLSICPKALRHFLETQTKDNGTTRVEVSTGRRVAAVVPMHTFGHPAQMDEILDICKEFQLPVVEDAAEGLGSLYKNRPIGSFGTLAAFSFNGNKIVTTGGGGAIATNSDQLADRLKYLSTTAKKPDPFEFIHTEVGYNFRLPNLNAALGVSQLRRFDHVLEKQQRLADSYRSFFKDQSEIRFIDQPTDSKSNFWMNAIRFTHPDRLSQFLELSRSENVMVRLIWRPMHLLEMFQDCPKGDMTQTELAYKSIVNIPSSINYSELKNER